MALAPAESHLVVKLRIAAWVLCGIAGLLLLVGAWRMLELALGPILAPLVAAAAMGLGAVALFIAARVYKQRTIARKPRVPTGLLISLAEIWLTPKSLRRSMVTGMALNWLHRQVLGR